MEQVLVPRELALCSLVEDTLETRPDSPGVHDHNLDLSSNLGYKMGRKQGDPQVPLHSTYFLDITSHTFPFSNQELTFILALAIQGCLACCDSWGRKELDTTERLK